MKFLLVSLLLLRGVTGFSQNCVVANRNSRPFYLGLENILIVSVEGYKTQEISVTADNGKIIQRNNDLIYIADSAGAVNFTIKTKNGKKTNVATFRYPVKKVSAASIILTINGQTEGQVNKSRLIMQQGIAAYFDWTEYGFVCLEGVKPFLQSYRLIVMRNDELIFSQESMSARFTEEAKELFKTLCNGDKLYVVGIKARMPSGGQVDLRPLEFEIITDEQRSERTSE